jgi:hypothetical protein
LKISGQKSRHRDVTLGIEKLNVNTEFLEITFLKRQIEDKEVNLLPGLPMKTSWPRAVELPKGLSVNSRNRSGISISSSSSSPSIQYWSFRIRLRLSRHASTPHKTAMFYIA